MGQDIHELVGSLDDLHMHNLPDDLTNLVVAMRVDINSPVNSDGMITDNAKIRAYKEDISWLTQRGAKVLVLSHQGKEGESDFISLEQHRRVLSDILFNVVKFVDHYRADLRQEIAAMKAGEVMLLDNIRRSSDETKDVIGDAHCNSDIARKLKGVAHVYIQNAFATIHRNHASMVAPPYEIPAFVGNGLVNEFKALEKILDDDASSRMFIIGGGKVKDGVKYVKGILDSGIAGKVFIGGLIGNVFLIAEGKSIGKETGLFMEKYANEIPRIKEMLASYGDRIILPIDVAVSRGNNREEYGVDHIPNDASALDIGPNTGEMLKRELDNVKSVIMRGPLGKIEDAVFTIGTRFILEELARRGIYTVLAGGHTQRIAEELGVAEKLPGYKCTGGGALVTAATGMELPGIDAVRKNSQRSGDFLKALRNREKLGNLERKEGMVVSTKPKSRSY
ncbi:MAG TPA: phosphoglycerate kinase [Candidatus Baltobacteraceae bacterium]|nr:phosphoglycerate kinase [Candidatus Baltobacteraceae bacterium]